MNNKYDIIIIGAGPAGLSAAIYAARTLRSVLVIEKAIVGGQQSMTEHIENYPGTGKEPLSGMALAEQMQIQAQTQGAEFLFDEVVNIELKDNKRIVYTSYNGSFESTAVIIATGRSAKKVGVVGESELVGKGVSYCATCDGAFYRDKKVAVIGGGNSALEEARFLTKFASKVYLIHRRNEFRAEKVVIQRTKENPKIEILTPYILSSIKGDNKVNSIDIINIENKEEKNIIVDGVFIYIGSTPSTEFCKDIVTIDKQGYIVADDKMRTITPGVYAVGDVLNKNLWQVVTAVSDGAIAGVFAEEYISEMEN
jgi:thioredoxin reductase (NADPH)